jgi:class 3 adenylate cyclase
MPDIEEFEFARSRGIVWVCDLASSSKYLNDNASADDLEAFLPRLHWTSSMAVGAAGGRFIKWTGDGFLAWFETPLHRNLGEKATAAFRAAWYLTILINVTQLGVSSARKFTMRHALTYEQDALLTKITHPGGYQSLDLTGRAVVLAFRLSGIEAHFPGIVTQQALVEANRGHGTFTIDFKKWNLKPEDRLKYFKGESWGIKSIYASGERKKRPGTMSAVLKRAKNALAIAQGKKRSKQDNEQFLNQFVRCMLGGPDWSKEAMSEFHRYLKDDLMEALKHVVGVISDVEKPVPNS